MPRPSAPNPASATATASSPSAAAPTRRRSGPIWRGTVWFRILRWCHPPSRAQETWTLAADYFAKPLKAANEERIYNASADNLLALVGDTGRARSLLLVGHNPGFHDFAAALIASGDVAARERLNESLPTAGLIVIDLALDDWALLHAHSGRLERFVFPLLIAATTE